MEHDSVTIWQGAKGGYVRFFNSGWAEEFIIFFGGLARRGDLVGYFFDQIFIEQLDDDGKQFQIIQIDMADGIEYEYRKGEWQPVSESPSLERPVLKANGKSVFGKLNRKTVDELVRIQRESKTVSSLRELPN